VQFPYEANGKGKFAEARDAALQGNFIVADLAEILGTALDDGARLSASNSPGVA